jgi:ribonuclease J
MVRPRIALPVHGETRHLLAQARLAEQCQVPQTVVTRNGEMIKLAPGPALAIGEVPTGRLVIDGTQLIAASSEAIKSRQRLVFNGAALASLVLDKNGKLIAPPQVTVHGLGDEADDLGVRLSERIVEALEELGPRERRDDEAVREAARLALRRSLKAWHGKRPVIEIHLVRL